MKFYKRMQFYFRQGIWREWQVALLLLILGGLFFGLFQILSNGIWDARQRPNHLVSGEILSIWPEVGFQSNLDPRSYIRVKLADEKEITLYAKYRLVAECKPHGPIQIRIYINESGEEFYQLGKKRCSGGEAKNSG